jgi:hypothetical protein
MKMWQARFDWACSLTSWSYRPRHLAPAEAEFNIEHEVVKFWM